MAAQLPGFREYEYNPDAPPAIVGELTSGAIGTIQVWQDGVELNLPISGCQELDSTGKFAWSTAHLPKPLASREQFHWQMDDDQPTAVILDRSPGRWSAIRPTCPAAWSRGPRRCPIARRYSINRRRRSISWWRVT